jgi:hypothetical protein
MIDGGNHQSPNKRKADTAEKNNKDYRISPFQAQGIQLIDGRVGEAACGHIDRIGV